MQVWDWYTQKIRFRRHPPQAWHWHRRSYNIRRLYSTQYPQLFMLDTGRGLFFLNDKSRRVSQFYPTPYSFIQAWDWHRDTRRLSDKLRCADIRGILKKIGHYN